MFLLMFRPVKIGIYEEDEAIWGMNKIALGDCCRFLSGGTPSKDNESFWIGNTPWFSPKDLKSFELADSQDHISQTAAVSSATQLVPPRTILVVVRSGVLAHTLPVGITQVLSAFNQDIKAIIPRETFDPEFIALYLKSCEGVVIDEGVKIGATVHSLMSGYLESLRVPKYSMKDQRRIATDLKSQLATVEEARNAAQLQLSELTNLANAIIRQSVEHPETDSNKLGDVLDEVKKGIGKTWAEYPVLGATRAGLALAKEPVGKSPERYKPVMCGTVFYNPMRIMIGSIAMVDEDDTPGITSPDYVALRGKEGLVDSRWFYYWLRSPYGVSCIASLARGAVRERMLFNRLAEGNIELPPYEVQVTASKALAELKPMRAAIEKQLAEINLLPGKILAKAFECL